MTVTALARAALVAAAGVVVVALAVAYAGMPGWLDTLLVLLAVALVVGVAWAGARVLRLPVLLVLDDDGLRLRGVRGAGPTNRAWTEVAGVRRERLGVGTCLVVVGTDGARTAVPLRLLDGAASSADRLEADLRARLDRVHGQRRIS